MSDYKKQLFQKYQYAEKKINNGFLAKTRKEKALYNLKRKMDRCFQQLEEPYSTVFNRAYLHVEDKFWWQDIYSSGTYYRYLKTARERFFSLFYRG